MNTLSSTAPSRAIVERVYKAFFSPGKYTAGPADESVLAHGDTKRIPFAGGELAVTTWGDQGPAVLLMHGWGGARAQMTGFVDPLLAAGYRVVAYDQPAHGDSDGRMTNILEIAPTMSLVLPPEGRFHAIIAHSFGTLITSYALAEGNFPHPSKLVYFGAFNRLMDSLPRFQVLAKLPDEVMAGLREMIDEKFGGEVLEAIGNQDLVKRIRIPALIYHDRSDSVTPVEDSRAIANAWPEAQYVETNGLDHRGALQSGEIHGRIVHFLKE